MPNPPFTVTPTPTHEGEREAFEGPHHDRPRMTSRPILTPGGADRRADADERMRVYEPVKSEPPIEDQFPDPLRAPVPQDKPYR